MTTSAPSPTRPPQTVVLDRELLDQIVSKARAAGVSRESPFVLLELDDDGMRGAVVDPVTGECLIENADVRLRPRNLDRAVADFLVREKRVAAPDTADQAQHLVDLAGEGRTKLADRHSTFVIGEPPVGLIRLDRADFSAALPNYFGGVAALVDSLASVSPQRVGAVVFTPEHRRWPGLAQAMHGRTGLATVALGSVELSDHSGRHTGEQPAVTEAVPAASMPAPAEAQTQVLPRIDTSPRAFSALPNTEHPNEATTALTPVPAQYSDQPTSSAYATGEVATEKVGAATASASSAPHTGGLRTGGFRTGGLRTGRLMALRREQNRKVMIAASVIAVLCLIGAILIAAPWRSDQTPSKYNATPPSTSSTPPPASTEAAPAPAPTSKPKPSPPSKQSSPTRPPPKPLVLYTTPPQTTAPAPTAQRTPDQTQQAPQRPSRRAPARPRCGNIFGIPLC